MRIFLIILLMPCYLLKSQVKVITINDRVNEFILIKGISNNILVTQPKKKAAITIRAKYGQINKIAARQFLYTVNYLGTDILYITSEYKNKPSIIDSFYCKIIDFPEPVLLININYRNDSLDKNLFKGKINMTIQNQVPFCCMSIKGIVLKHIRQDSLINKFEIKSNYIDSTTTDIISRTVNNYDRIRFENILISIEGTIILLKPFELVLY